MHLSSKESETPGIIGDPVFSSLTLPADVVVSILVMGAEDSATEERKKYYNQEFITSGSVSADWHKIESQIY